MVPATVASVFEELSPPLSDARLVDEIQRRVDEDWAALVHTCEEDSS
jgi:hypothetical protein